MKPKIARSAGKWICYVGLEDLVRKRYGVGSTIYQAYANWYDKVSVNKFMGQTK